jgi:hypothetical protein
MFRREEWARTVLMGSLMAAVWLLCGCGEAPTGPPSPTSEATMGEGVADLEAAPPIGISASQGDEDLVDVRHPRGGWVPRYVPRGWTPSGTPGRLEPGQDLDSRYALAKAQANL